MLRHPLQLIHHAQTSHPAVRVSNRRTPVYKRRGQSKIGRYQWADDFFVARIEGTQVVGNACMPTRARACVALAAPIRLRLIEDLRLAAGLDFGDRGFRRADFFR